MIPTVSSIINALKNLNCSPRTGHAAIAIVIASPPLIRAIMIPGVQIDSRLGSSGHPGRFSRRFIRISHPSRIAIACQITSLERGTFVVLAGSAPFAAFVVGVRFVNAAIVEITDIVGANGRACRAWGRGFGCGGVDGGK